MVYTCPVCGYDRLPRPPEDYLICPSCGTEFDYDDFRTKHTELRRRWIVSGAKWQSSVIPSPPNWSPFEQMRRAGFEVPAISGRPISSAGAKISPMMYPNLINFSAYSPVSP